MISANDLQKDTIFMFNREPHKVLSANHKKIARQGATVQAKLKNIKNGATVTRNFSSTEKFDEAEIEKKDLLFLYAHRGEYVFVDPGDKSQRFHMKSEDLEEKTNFLNPGTAITAQFFEGDIINIVLPIKVNLKVQEAPPNVKGNTASGGTKTIKLETGATVQAPLFVETGDVVRVNTQKGEYVERVNKAK